MKKAIAISTALIAVTAAGATAFAASTGTGSEVMKHFRGQGHTMSGETASGRMMPQFEEFAFSGITDTEKATLKSLRDAEKAERDATEKLSDADKAELKTLRETQQAEMKALMETQQKATRALLATKGVTVVSEDLVSQAKAIMEKYKPANAEGEGFGPGMGRMGMEGFKHGGKMKGHEESSSGSTQEPPAEPEEVSNNSSAN